MIDWTKPIRTKKGAEARLLGELKNVAHPMVVAVTYTNGLGITYEVMQRYTRDGRFAETTHWRDHPMHLENVPEVTKRYIMLFDGVGYGDINEVMQMRRRYWPDCQIVEITSEDGKPVKLELVEETD